MRLLTYVDDGVERVGLVAGEEIVDLSCVVPSMQALVEGGEVALERVRAAMSQAARVPLAGARLLAPFPRPSKNILCLGVNYKDHADEGARIGATAHGPAQYPVWFSKAVTSVCGPFDDIVVDTKLSTQYDWEVELMVVIGKGGRSIQRERAMEHVFGYTVFNDFSVRDVQLRHGASSQWFKGKSFDRASPMGPWLVTADELGTPPKVRLTCHVNGVLKQASNTELMIFDIATALADISEAMTLEPGDLIATGTPSGIGLARKPAEFMKPGDVMETEVEGIGALRNRLVEIRQR